MMHVNSRLIQVMTAAMLVATLYSESQAQDAKKIPPAKPTKDVVTSVYNATTLPSGIVIKETNAGDYAYNQLLSSFNWSNSALYQIAHAIPDSKGCAGLVSNQAYIINVAQWKVNSSESTLSLISSNWYAYREHDANNVAQVKEKPNKQPLLYAVKQALFVGLNFFDDDVDAKKLKVSYKVSATEAKADNVVALGQLLAAVMGLTVPAAGGESPNNTRLLVAAGCKTGTENLPFDFNVSFSLTAPDKSSNDGASQASASDQQHEQPQDTIRSEGGAASQGSGGQKPNGTKDNSGSTTPSKPSDNTKKAADNNVVDCSATGSKKPCTFTRTFRSDDIEWWDVSIGVTIPGVREAKYTDTGNTVQRNVTTHTDLYGLFDIYPTAEWKTKESWVPHFNLGIPLTSQPFYRPYFGVAENFTGWTTLEKHGFPFRMSFYVGIVDMKQSLLKGLAPGSSATQGQFSSALVSDRALKPLFGVEVPVSALISKVGQKSSNSKNSGTPGAASNTGGNQ
jgi:hypothetical protein